MIVALVCVVLALSVIALARWQLGRRWLVITVRGDSLSPTLRAGERLVVRRPRGRPLAYATGDIIVFAVGSPPLATRSGPDHRVKRIAAVAGEPVPGWARAALGAREDALVPADRVVGAGDNARSQDSRQLGYIAVSAIVAVAPPRPPLRGADRPAARAT